MGDIKIQNLSLACASLVYSIIYIWFINNVLSEQALQPVFVSSIRIVISFIGIVVLKNTFSYLAYLYFARRMLGKWPYESDAGTFALAIIQATSSGIHYKVDLYKTAHEVIHALDKNSEATPFGRAHDEMSKYMADEITFVYSINYSDTTYDKRKGILHLVSNAANPDTMSGFWESTIDAKDKNGTPTPKSGRLRLYRERAFRHKFA